MFIEGFGISGYRSFGEPIQRIGPCRKINLLVGQNNSGKSNILRFLASHYHRALNSAKREGTGMALEFIDKPTGRPNENIVLEFALVRGGMIHAQLVETNRSVATLIDKILSSQTLSAGTAMSWFRYEQRHLNEYEFDHSWLESLLAEGIMHVNKWHDLQRHISGGYGGDMIKQVLPTVLRALSPVRLQIPNVAIIPAIRRIGNTGETADDHSGIDLIDRLVQLQNPSLQEQDKKQDFEKINTFLQRVTDNATARIEIPHDRETILVHMDGRTLPLASLGTGIHEVVILAAASTVLRDQILCIEEPELHLHPLLQRKLLRYLSDNTTNQYFITTHSAHLLDAVSDAAIFHIRHQDHKSTVEPVYTAVGRSEICADLGYRASDLLQANCVIWVEGPSDRIYLRHWIHSEAPELVEGIHYSIMFYGGRLLSHLTANDPEVDDFISLRRLNRYIAILIDSDRKSIGARINKTKGRVREEFDKGPGFAWITKGREIENYIKSDLLLECVQAVHSDVVKLNETGQFDHCLPFVNQKKKVVTNVDKVKVAHEVVKHPANLDVLDLRSWVRRTVEFIRSANDLE